MAIRAPDGANNEKYIGTAGKSAKWLANIPQKAGFACFIESAKSN